MRILLLLTNHFSLISAICAFPHFHQLLSKVPSDNLREVVSTRENKDITQSNPSNLMKKQQDENALIKNISTDILTGVTDFVRSNTTEKSMCSSKYSKRSFFSPSAARLPPMLYSFPGSGNTWCRLLIEYGLGIYSGPTLFRIYLHRIRDIDSCCSFFLHWSILSFVNFCVLLKCCFLSCNSTTQRNVFCWEMCSIFLL